MKLSVAGSAVCPQPVGSAVRTVFLTALVKSPLFKKLVVRGPELRLCSRELRSRLAADGVLCSGTGPQRVRMVTHLDIGDAEIEAALATTGRVLEELRAG